MYRSRCSSQRKPRICGVCDQPKYETLGLVMNEGNEGNNGSETFERRLKRIESKLVRGFEELGVGTEVDSNWLSVDNRSKSVTITTMGRSLKVIQQRIKERGASNYGDWHIILFRGDVVANVLFDPPA